MLRCNLLKNEKSLVRNFLYLIFNLLRYFTLLMQTYVLGLVTLRHDARCSVYFMRHVFNGTMAQLWSENLVSARDYFFFDGIFNNARVTKVTMTTDTVAFKVVVFFVTILNVLMIHLFYLLFFFLPGKTNSTT